MCRALLVFGVFVWCACPGSIEDPSRFVRPDECTTPIDQILEPSCGTAGCHARESPAAELDLVSDGIARRLVDVTSMCDGQPLVDSTDPQGGIMLNKLEERPRCGGRMPVGTTLSTQERVCIVSWIAGLARGGDGGADGGATDLDFDQGSDLMGGDGGGT